MLSEEAAERLVVHRAFFYEKKSTIFRDAEIEVGLSGSSFCRIQQPANRLQVNMVALG